VGIAGRIARAFLQSKLTPLITLASLATGALALMATPREEEPQISVPMIDIFVQAPALQPRELENLAIRGLERRMWEIPGVDHVYSMAGDGQGMVTVRFKVGQNQENSIVKVQAKLASSMDELPAGISPPLVKAHSIDDGPILAITLHSKRYGSDQLANWRCTWKTRSAPFRMSRKP
jgi:multidrug efflux pump subunit AcrB